MEIKEIDLTIQDYVDSVNIFTDGRFEELKKKVDEISIEFKKLGEVCNFKRGSSLTSKQAISGKIPVISGGQKPAFYHNEANRYGEIITVAGSGVYAGFVNYWDIPIFCADCFSVLPKDINILLTKYLYYFLKKNQDLIYHKKVGGAIPHVYSKMLTDFEIPIPPLELQEEIVNNLDVFTNLISNLEKIITLRKKQYSYYLDELLTFGENTQKVKLGEIGKISMCKRIMKNETNSVSGVPFYKIGTFGGKADSYISEELFEEYVSKYSYPKKGDILISTSGTIGKLVVFDGRPAYFQDSNIVWVANNEEIALNKYLYYIYQTSPWKITKGGTIARLYNGDIANTEIPLPTLDIQKEIVHYLDQFTTLISLLEKKLELTKKQYAYYRDELLRFERK